MCTQYKYQITDKALKKQLPNFKMNFIYIKPHTYLYSGKLFLHSELNNLLDCYNML